MGFSKVDCHGHLFVSLWPSYIACDPMSGMGVWFENGRKYFHHEELSTVSSCTYLLAVSCLCAHF